MDTIIMNQIQGLGCDRKLDGLRIVFVTNKYGNGGTERRAMELANSFASRGYDVTYLVFSKIFDDVVYRLDDRVELVFLSQFEKKYPNEMSTAVSWGDNKYQLLCKKHRVAKHLGINDLFVKRKRNQIKTVTAIRAFMRLNQNAIYIVFGLDFYEKLYYASEGLNVKIIFSEINSPRNIQEEHERDVLIHIQSKLLKKAACCVFQTYDQYLFYIDYAHLRYKVIRNPITDKLPVFFGGQRRPVVVNFCRTHPVKNLLLLVNAFYMFSQEFPDYLLYIYGATSTPIAINYKKQVVEQIEKLELNDKVIIFEAVSDVHQRINDCSMFVSSSDSEGLSNSMLEAMAMGLPCVCTDCLGGGAREMIQNEDNGLLVPVKDEEALYKAMKRMIEEPELAEKCGRNAAKVREELSIERITDQWIEMINHLR